MKKGMMGGIVVAVAIAIVFGITQNQDIESVPDDITAETIADTSQTLNESSENSQDCSGTAKCVTGSVTKIVKGDTIHVDEQSVRFSLITSPNLEGYGGVDSRNFIQTICPIGSEVLIDEDDGHVLKDHARMVGMVTCNGVILNQEILDANLANLEIRFCSSSEFATEDWAVKHGCKGE
jgi:micrococcal nuclease